MAPWEADDFKLRNVGSFDLLTPIIGRLLLKVRGRMKLLSSAVLPDANAYPMLAVAGLPGPDHPMGETEGVYGTR